MNNPLIFCLTCCWHYVDKVDRSHHALVRIEVKCNTKFPAFQFCAEIIKVKVVESKSSDIFDDKSGIEAENKRTHQISRHEGRYCEL